MRTAACLILGSVSLFVSPQYDALGDSSPHRWQRPSSRERTLPQLAHSMEVFLRVRRPWKHQESLREMGFQWGVSESDPLLGARPPHHAPQRTGSRVQTRTMPWLWHHGVLASAALNPRQIGEAPK
jgi:hypothetical protein